MNIIQMQDRLKDLSDNQLRTYVEKPRNMQGSGIGQGGTSHGYVPTFLVLGEMKRRKDSRSKYEGEKTQQKTTVADDLVAEQGIGGNQMTRNPMSQPTAGVGTPQPQEPVNPAMLASKGIGQLNPGAVKQMNDGGIVGYAGTDGVSLVGEDKPSLKEIQAQMYNNIDYRTEDKIQSMNEDEYLQNFLINNQPKTIDKDPIKNLDSSTFQNEISGNNIFSSDFIDSSINNMVKNPIQVNDTVVEENVDVAKVDPQADNIEALINEEKFKNNQALLNSAGEVSETVTVRDTETDFEGAKLNTGILDTSIYEETNPILEGDKAMESYEKRVGVSPFVALAGKYEQEIGENIAENKKQSIGKFLFNFGSELANSGQVGKALKVGGKDFEKDMDRLTALKREQRKVNFDIAKITDMERMTKGKLGADVEAREKLMNNKRKLQKNADILKRDENEYKKKYYNELGIKALEEAKYLKGFDSAQKGALVSSFDLATKTVFGDENEYKKWKNRENKIKAYQEKNNTSYEQAAAEVLKSFPANKDTEHIKLGKDFTQAQVSFYEGLSPKAIRGAPTGMTYSPETGLTGYGRTSN